MKTELYIIAHDNGTSGTKTVLAKITDKIEIVSSHLTEYEVFYPEGIPNACEQDPKDWWRAICDGTKKVMEESGLSPDQINGITFSTQTQCSLFVDENGEPLDRAYIWIDGRATKEFEKGIRSGLKVSGYNLRKILKYIKITGGGPGSAKDPLWKYLWFKNNKPEQFKKVHKMLDVKDYLIFKCTGHMISSPDAACTTWLLDTRPGKNTWNKDLCKMNKIDMKHLPDIKPSIDVAGELMPTAAEEMGLVAGIPVIMGGTDTSCISVGSGAVDINETHLYVGTSGWIITTVDKRMTDLADYEASIPGANPQTFSYIGIMETAGACLAWARDHLADLEVAKAKEEGTSAYRLLDEMVEQTPPGASGVIFTPWLYGNRCPREDTHVRGAFFNLGLNTGRRDMFRAILEGVALHTRWMMEKFSTKHVAITEPIRYVGGGAKSPVWCQIMADILGKKIQPVTYAQDGGAVGAILIAAVGLKQTSFKEGKNLIPVDKIYTPNQENKPIYDKLFNALVQFHANNQKLYHVLNP
ncbi:MAG TPA: FGGY-family carbohydrate kinase [Candidatus Lokiarchaeia archaeon]|nr:FGGY-family carbohydrate kinase [Candidatus Lokiarchaeia archaeon]